MCGTEDGGGSNAIDNSNGSRHRRRRPNHQQQDEVVGTDGTNHEADAIDSTRSDALDLPPPVTLPFQGTNALLSMRTSRSLASGRIVDSIIGNTNGQDGNHDPWDATFSNCNPLIAFERFVVFAALSTSTIVSTTDEPHAAIGEPQICFYQLTTSSPSSSSEVDISGSTDSEVILSPVITTPLVDGTAPIIALVATTHTSFQPECLTKDTAAVDDEKVPPVTLEEQKSDDDRDDKKTNPHIRLGYVVALASDGMIHVMECREWNHNKNHDASDDKPVVLLVSWQTGHHARSASSCIAIHPRKPDSTNDDKGGKDEELLRVVVGFHSGCIETWSLFRNNHAQQKRRDGKPQVDLETRLMWSGIMRQPVLALHILQQHQNDGQIDVIDETTKTSTSKEDSSEEKIKDDADLARTDLLIVCLQPSTESVSARLAAVSFLQSSSPKLLEVLDLHEVERAWNISLRHQDNAKTGRPGNGMSMSLSQFAVVPVGPSGSQQLPPIETPYDGIHQILLCGNARASSTHCNQGFICSLDEDGTKCAAFLGNKAVVSLGLNSPTSSAWSISSDYHPLLLSYPTVGCGAVRFTCSGSDPNQYAACCLRGGTVYLIPTTYQQGNGVDEETNRNIGLPTVHVYPFPHELDLDLEARFLQGFTAGMLRIVSRERRDEVREPVLVYAWPGGYFDIFSCSLTRPVSEISADQQVAMTTNTNVESPDQTRLLRELLENGSVHLLEQLLEALGSDDPLLQEAIWNKAFVEYGARPLHQEWTLDLLLSDDFESLRTVLLELSQVVDE